LTRFTRLAAITLVLTFALVVVGVVVRSTGSGLGCPAWPLCYGSLVPPFNDVHAIIEWSHRTTAAVVGLLVFAVGVAAVASYRGRASILWPSLVGFVLVVFQAALGKVTVESELSGDIVTAHLATAMALLALLVYVAVRSGLPARIGPRGGWDRVTLWMAATAVAVYALLLLGSHVTATGTALVFPDWPLMNGTPFPAMDAGNAPHVIHRWAAVIVGLVLAAGTLVAWRTRNRRPWVARLVASAALLYVIQAVVGGLQVFTDLSAWSQVLHLSLGAAIWCLLVAATVMAHYAGRLEAQPLGEPLPGGEREPDRRPVQPTSPAGLDS
jgi:heme A synthase